MNAPHDLKALQTRLREATREADSCEERATRAMAVWKEALDNVTKIETQIRELEDTAKEPIVSEHALLRYIERFMGVDLESVRRAILTETAVKMIKFTRNGKVTTDGRRLIIKNGTVVTIEPTKEAA
jgi:hypothetical protein